MALLPEIANSSNYISIEFDEAMVSQTEIYAHSDCEYSVGREPLDKNQEFQFRLEFEDGQYNRNMLIVEVSSTASDNPLQLYLAIVNNLVKDGWKLISDPEVAEAEVPTWTFAYLDLILNSVNVALYTVTDTEVLFEFDSSSDKEELLKNFLKGLRQIPRK